MNESATRIVVDGTTHPIHDDATGVTMSLVLDDATAATVQIAHVGLQLVVIVLGDVDQGRDARGNLRLIVSPNEL